MLLNIIYTDARDGCVGMGDIVMDECVYLLLHDIWMGVNKLMCTSPSRVLFAADMTPCQRCPDNSICAGGVDTYTEAGIPIPMPGYLRDPSNYSRMLICEPVESCGCGLDELHALACANGCQEGYNVSYQCQVCSESYFRFNTRCEKCMDRFAVTWVNVLMPVEVFVHLILLCGMYFFYEVVSKSASLGILMSYMETIYLISFFRVQWPAVYIEGFRYFSFIVPAFFYPNWMESAGLECQLGQLEYANSWLQFKYMYIAPLLMPVVQIVFLCLLCIMQFFYDVIQQMYKKPQVEGVTRMQRLVGSIVAVLFLDITFLLRTAANIFSYFTQSNGERVFYIRPFLPFELPDWNDYYFTLIALIFGGFFVVFPIYVLCDPNTVTTRIENSHRKYNFFFKRHKSRWRRWDLMVIIRKLCLVGATSGLVRNPVFQAFLAMAPIFIGMVLHVYAQPFKLQSSNNYEALSMAIQLVFVFSTLIFSMQNLVGELGTLIFEKGVGPFCFCFFVVLLVHFCDEFVMRYKIFRKKIALRLHDQLHINSGALEGKKHGLLSPNSSANLMNVINLGDSHEIVFVHSLTKLLLSVSKEYIPSQSINSLLANHSMYRVRLEEVRRDIFARWLAGYSINRMSWHAFFHDLLDRSQREVASLRGDEYLSPAELESKRQELIRKAENLLKANKADAESSKVSDVSPRSINPKKLERNLSKSSSFDLKNDSEVGVEMTPITPGQSESKANSDENQAHHNNTIKESKVMMNDLPITGGIVSKTVHNDDPLPPPPTLPSAEVSSEVVELAELTPLKVEENEPNSLEKSHDSEDQQLHQAANEAGTVVRHRSTPRRRSLGRTMSLEFLSVLKESNNEVEKVEKDAVHRELQPVLNAWILLRDFLMSDFSMDFIQKLISPKFKPDLAEVVEIAKETIKGLEMVHTHLSDAMSKDKSCALIDEATFIRTASWLTESIFSLRSLTFPNSFLDSPDYMLSWSSDIQTSRHQFDDVRAAMQKLIHDFKYMVNVGNSEIMGVFIQTEVGSVRPPVLVQFNIVQPSKKNNEEDEKKLALVEKHWQGTEWALSLCPGHAMTYVVALRDLYSDMKVASSQTQFSVKLIPVAFGADYEAVGNIQNNDGSNLSENSNNLTPEKSCCESFSSFCASVCGCIRNSCFKCAVSLQCVQRMNPRDLPCTSTLSQPAKIRFVLPEDLEYGQYRLELLINGKPLTNVNHKLVNQLALTVPDSTQIVENEARKDFVTQIKVEKPLSNRHKEIHVTFIGGSAGKRLEPGINELFDLTEGALFKLTISAPRPGGAYRVELFRQRNALTVGKRKALDKILVDDHTTSNHRGDACYLKGGAGALEPNKANYNVTVQVVNADDFELKIYLGNQLLSAPFLFSVNRLPPDVSTFRYVGHDVDTKEGLHYVAFQIFSKDSKDRAGRADAKIHGADEKSEIVAEKEDEIVKDDLNLASVSYLSALCVFKRTAPTATQALYEFIDTKIDVHRMILHDETALEEIDSKVKEHMVAYEEKVQADEKERLRAAEELKLQQEQSSFEADAKTAEQLEQEHFERVHKADAARETEETQFREKLLTALKLKQKKQMMFRAIFRAPTEGEFQVRLTIHGDPKLEQNAQLITKNKPLTYDDKNRHLPRFIKRVSEMGPPVDWKLLPAEQGKTDGEWLNLYDNERKRIDMAPIVTYTCKRTPTEDAKLKLAEDAELLMVTQNEEGLSLGDVLKAKVSTGHSKPVLDMVILPLNDRLITCSNAEVPT